MNQSGDFLGSVALVLSDDRTICVLLDQWFEPAGWRFDCIAPDDDLSRHADGLALVIIDRAVDAMVRTEFVAKIRAMPGPIAGTPLLLLCDPDSPAQAGVAGRIERPLQRDDVAEAMEIWAGPLEDHLFRTPSNPLYRLVRLAGRTSAGRLFASFADHAESALASLDRGEDVKRTAHNIAGLAGTMGFADVSRLWSAIERDESADLEEARIATRAVLEDVRILTSAY